nr:MAG TPA: hypothetical protein [Caudoviricetes sp.]
MLIVKAPQPSGTRNGWGLCCVYLIYFLSLLISCFVVYTGVISVL